MGPIQTAGPAQEQAREPAEEQAVGHQTMSQNRGKRGHRKGQGASAGTGAGAGAATLPTKAAASAVQKGDRERRCAVTRIAKASQDMIRFVLSPDLEVVPDLKASLPGRGVWVTATAPMVAEAVKTRAFARGFKAKVTVDPDLSDKIDALLVERLLRHLGLARKAGQLVTGFAKVDAALRSDELAVLITATDAAADGQEKLKRLAKAVAGSRLCFVGVADSQQLSMALGLEHVIHAGVMKNHMAGAVEIAARRLVSFRGGG